MPYHYCHCSLPLDVTKNDTLANFREKEQLLGAIQIVLVVNNILISFNISDGEQSHLVAVGTGKNVLYLIRGNLSIGGVLIPPPLLKPRISSYRHYEPFTDNYACLLGINSLPNTLR